LCKDTQCLIHIISELYNIVSEKLEIEEIAGISAFRLQPYNQKSSYEIIKRIFDVFSFYFVNYNFVTYLDYNCIVGKNYLKRANFYKAGVIGKDGCEFDMFKFRSMYHNCNPKPHKDKIKEMINNFIKQAQKEGSAITLLGRKRPLSDINSNIPMIRKRRRKNGY